MAGDSIARRWSSDRRRTLARLGVDPSTLDLLSVIRRAGPPYGLTTREITRRTLITEAGLIGELTTAERTTLTGILARLEQTLVAVVPTRVG